MEKAICHFLKWKENLKKSPFLYLKLSEKLLNLGRKRLLECGGIRETMALRKAFIER
jgi:hypothetical protein